jgi:nucleoid-associated protein YgaU
LGRHSKPSRIRVPQAAVVAAVPTMAGVAVTLCLSPQAAQAMPVSAGGPVVALAAAPHSDPADAATSPDRAAAAATKRRLPSSYTVRPGDSLSSIANRLYHDAAAWPLLYWRNAGEIRWADDIQAGQVLRVPAEPARLPAAPAALGPPAPVAAPPAAAPAPQAAAGSALAAAPYDGGVPGGAFGQCVIARESGGDAQVMNSTGHYGLYQFSASTWAKYGGNPADFGAASVAEQNQVFANALAAGGESNWAPYDGC